MPDILWLLIITVCSDFPLLLSQSWCSPPFWDAAPAAQMSSMLPRTAPRVHLRSLPLPVSLTRDASHVRSGTPATSRSVLFIFPNNQLPACGLPCGLCLTVSSLLPSLAALGLFRWLLRFQLLKAVWLRVPRLRRGARSCAPPSGHRLCCLSWCAAFWFWFLTRYSLTCPVTSSLTDWLLRNTLFNSCLL